MIDRIALSSIIWVACAPALFFYGLLSLGAVHKLAANNFLPPQDAPLFTYSFVFGIIAWLLLAIMNAAWVKLYRLGLFIPVAGTATALLGFAPFLARPWYFLLALPGVLFAAFLVRWHSTQSK